MGIWATSGLAAMPTALAAFGCYERLLGDPARPRGLQAGAFGLLAALVRADGALWVGLVFLSAGLLWLLDGRPRALLRALVAGAAVVAVGVGAHVAWRYAYYGDVVPNTAHGEGRLLELSARPRIRLPPRPTGSRCRRSRWRCSLPSGAGTGRCSGCGSRPGSS